MAIQVIPKEIQDLWHEWNLRVAVLFSLFIQILLIFFAPARKRSGSVLLQMVIWCSYLLADWVAAFAVGLISNSQGQKTDKVTTNDALVAFWAPFLLLHLGGPDSITAFSLEDNELWLRHMLNFVVQVLAVAYVFTQSVPNKFWLPTLLVFLAGMIKYAERIRALYLACLSNLKDSIRLDRPFIYSQMMEEYRSRQATHFHRVTEPGRETRDLELPAEIRVVPDHTEEAIDSDETGRTELNEVEIIQLAYSFYNSFKGLVADHMFSSYERQKSRKFFLSLTPEEAFKTMEAELNFIYDVLYTKMEAVHNGIFGYILRFVCTSLIVAAIVLFFSHHKPNIGHFDIVVTYALLVGAVVLDFIALVKLVYSDWTIALLEHSEALSIIRPVLERLKIPSTSLAIQKSISFNKRWSENMYQHSFISYSLKKRHGFLEKIADFFALKESLHSILYRRKQRVNDCLLHFIFNEVRDKALKAVDINFAKVLYSSRGEWTLRNYDCPESIKQSVNEHVGYDESILIWHIATEICYSRPSNGEDTSAKENQTRCKQMSDYLLYLLMMQPKFMSSVSDISESRFKKAYEEIKIMDTSAEARMFFERRTRPRSEMDACVELLRVNTDVPPVAVKGDRSKSVLFHAVRLAKDLVKMADDNTIETWEMMSKVWVELLCYGASHCRGDAHAQQLRQGGELVTFVWLLMAHFGLGEQFRLGN